MDHSKHYDLLINRARNRVLEEYTERHHIHPKCLGGGNEPENLVRLTPEEHYTAHLLLCGIYPGNYNIILAARMMCYGKDGRRVNNKLYGWLKRKHKEAVSKVPRKPRKKETKPRNRDYTMSEEQKAKLSAAMKGRVHSPEAISKMSAAQKGKPRQYPNGMLGRKHSEETKKKISEAGLRRYSSSYFRLDNKYI